MLCLTRIEDIINRIMPYISHFPDTISLKLIASLNKISGDDFISKINLPPYPKATMDGFAVRQIDISGASRENPVFLKLRDDITLPYKLYDYRLNEGECFFIETGCFLPKNADAVVKIEDSVVEGDLVYIMKTPAKYENVSLVGEELSEGDIILKKGMRIKPWHIAALRLHKINRVSVLNLKALVIGTGREFIKNLHEPFTLELVKGWLSEYGFIKIDEEIVNDDENEIIDLINDKISSYNIIIFCGGTSMGKKDITVKALRKLKPKVEIHGVALRPGKTTFLSIIHGKLVVAISGLPVAAYANLELLIGKLLDDWLKAEPLPRCKVKAILTRRVTTKSGVRGFVRVKLNSKDNKVYATPILTGGSGSLRSLLLSNGYLIIPEDIEGYDEGEVVEVVVHTPF